MKKIVVALVAFAMVFAFTACENKTPEPETTAMTEELVAKLDNSLGSIAWNAETGVADIKKEGAFFQQDIEAGKIYTVSYDLTINKAEEGTVEFNHNLFTADPANHYCQAYLVLTLSNDGIAVEMRPETDVASAEELEAIAYEGDVAKVNITATYAPIDDSGNYSVTVSVNGDDAAPVKTAGTADSIFWCLYKAAEGAGSIDSFTVSES